MNIRKFSLNDIIYEIFVKNTILIRWKIYLSCDIWTEYFTNKIYFLCSINLFRIKLKKVVKL